MKKQFQHGFWAGLLTAGLLLALGLTVLAAGRTISIDDGIRITVEDDGVGMDQKTLAESFSRITPPGHATVSGGYGIRNIAERLTLAYGSPYGLSCESSPGKGTTVTVHIPAILPEEEQEES